MAAAAKTAPKKKPASPISEITDHELELLLKMLQETQFVEWPLKRLAAQVQERVDLELKQR